MMDWIAEHWAAVAGGGVGLLAVIALAVLNPAAAIRLASQVAGLALDAGRSLVAWLRKPGNKLKGACAVLALGFSLAALWSYDLNQQVTVITAARDAAIGERDTARTEAAAKGTRIGELEFSLKTYLLQEQAYADLQRHRTEELERLQQQNASAMALLEAQRDMAERSSKAWWAEYAKRPDSCKAAQEALDVACSGLGEF